MSSFSLRSALAFFFFFFTYFLQICSLETTKYQEYNNGEVKKGGKIMGIKKTVPCSNGSFHFISDSVVLGKATFNPLNQAPSFALCDSDFFCKSA